MVIMMMMIIIFIIVMIISICVIFVSALTSPSIFIVVVRHEQDGHSEMYTDEL